MAPIDTDSENKRINSIPRSQLYSHYRDYLDTKPPRSAPLPPVQIYRIRIIIRLHAYRISDT
jgi:hypothetical protein